MSDLFFQSSLLARDHKLFLELSPEETEVWVGRVFDAIRPQMNLIRAMTFDGDTASVPMNLEAVLLIASRKVREVAVEMAAELLTPERQRRLAPMLDAYCDELLAEGRGLDAIFIQQGLTDIRGGRIARQNLLLVEICMVSIFHQVSLINGDPNKIQKAL